MLLQRDRGKKSSCFLAKRTRDFTSIENFLRENWLVLLGQLRNLLLCKHKQQVFYTIMTKKFYSYVTVDALFRVRTICQSISRRPPISPYSVKYIITMNHFNIFN